MTYDRTHSDVGRRASSNRNVRPAPVAVGRASAHAARRGRSRGGLFAPRADDRRLRVAGAALAAAGLLMVIFSFFAWTSAAGADLRISVTGMGTVSLEVSPERAEALGGAEQARAELDKRSKSPGLVTAALGVLLIGAAVPLISNRFPGLGALAGVALALIAVFMSLEYLFAPGAAVLQGTGDAGIGYAAAGLWTVTAGAAAAVAVSGYAALVATGSRPRPAPAPRRAQRPAPGYRARMDEPTDLMGRRPSQGRRTPQEQHTFHEPRPGRRPAPHAWEESRPRPQPRAHPNRAAAHHDSRQLPPIRRSAPNPRPDRGLPPMPRSAPPPSTGYRQPNPPRRRDETDRG